MIKSLVGIIMGSDSDFSVMKDAVKILKDFDIDIEVSVISAHRTPEKAVKYAKEAENRGIRVLIAGAGKAAHLPGVLAAFTVLPVIGVPVKSSTFDGLDALFSIVQMPPGIPVATVGVDGAKNAGLLALEILASTDDTLRKKLKDYRNKMAQEVEKKDENIKNEIEKL